MIGPTCYWFGINHYKVYWVVEFVHLTNTSSTIPLGIFTDRSANDRVMLVGLSSPKPNCLYTDYGSRFTFTPKSNSALSMQVPPMLTDIVGDPRSLYFTGVLLLMMALTCSIRKAFFSMPNRFLTVHRSFKNFAKVGTCLIMSSSGIFTFTCLSTS